jgi:hypothetical protein
MLGKYNQSFYSKVDERFPARDIAIIDPTVILNFLELFISFLYFWKHHVGNKPLFNPLVQRFSGLTHLTWL